MGNDRNLRRCLDSILRYTSIKFEMFVVAYLFPPNGTLALQKKYPWIRIIESNEIRGFSENNNLALQYCTGEYCLILNDDTFIDRPVIDRLLDTIRHAGRHVAVISPTLRFPDGTLQKCGRPRLNFGLWYLSCCHLWSENTSHSPYINGNGIFKTYNICGAAFLIRTDVFKSAGWFDERYFFCPEDVALSTWLNQKGYTCLVDADLPLFHLEGGTWSSIQSAIMPASRTGALVFYAQNSRLKKLVFSVLIFLLSFAKWIYWSILAARTDRSDIMSRAHRNTCATICSRLTAKDIFIRYYRPSKSPASTSNFTCPS